MDKKVTLAQIACKTGFSTNAVSRALNNKSDISEATKEKIKAAAEEMGYVTNYSAKALRIGKTNIIAVIMPDLFNPLYAMIANEIECCMSAFGYSVMLLNSNGAEEKENRTVISAMEKGVDGVIICPVDTDTEGMRKLINGKIPFVSVEKYVGYPEAGYIMRDDTRGGFIAVEHLVTLGHTNILVIMKDKEDYCTQQKVDGIKGCCSSYGLSFNENVIRYVGGNKDKISSQLDKILFERKYTAVVCGDDIIALQVSYLLIKSGKKIPEDVSVVGFGNLQSQIVAFPMLTTVAIPFEKLSMNAAEILIAKIKKESIDDKRILPVELKLRESTLKLKE